MKDKLLYLTIGLLIGIVVMQWTMPTGQASGVHPGTGIVAVDDNWLWAPWVLDQNGQTWIVSLGYGWALAGSEHDPPVPASQIKFWNQRLVITTDNVAWYSDGSNPWVNLGPWPGGPVPTSPNTWGGVKGKYEGKK